MSHEVTPRAYQTRLGNIPAKSVLALVADVANDDGYGWPSVEKIAAKTEISARTVLRVLQVFVAIGLIARVDRGRDRAPGLQLDLAKLGADLRAEFAAAYAGARGECPTDSAGSVPGTAASVPGTAASVPGTAASVPGTAASVPGTVTSVPRTLPPDPLIGGTAIEPLVEPPPTPPQAGGAWSQEQLAHLETVRPQDRPMWERYYRECNEAEAAQLAQAPAGKDAKREETLKAILTDERKAAEWVMRECGFVPRRRGLAQALAAVIAQRMTPGDAPWRVAERMAEAWREYVEAAPRLRVVYGPVKFFELGIWEQRTLWLLDYQRLREDRRRAEARVGGCG